MSTNRIYKSPSHYGNIRRRRYLDLLSAGGGGSSVATVAEFLSLDPVTKEILNLKTGTGPFSFTRDSDVYVPDFENIHRVYKTGQPAIIGGRKVENLTHYSNQFDNAIWTKISAGTGSTPVVTSGFTDPDGGSTAWRLQADRGAGNTGSDYSVLRQSVGVITPNIKSVYVKSNTGSSQEVTFSAGSGTETVTVTTSWQRMSTVSSQANFDIGSIGGETATNSVDILIWCAQQENPEGRTDTVTPYEYLPTNIQIPEDGYHDVGVSDWEHILDPTLGSGDPVPFVWSETNKDMTWARPGASIYGYPNFYFDVVPGQKYYWSLKNKGGATSYIGVGYGTTHADGNRTAYYVNGGVGGGTTVSGSFVAAEGVDYAVIYMWPTGAGATCTWDNLEVSAGYATKNFGNENGNSIASNVVTEAVGTELSDWWGLFQEPAKTNVWTYSSDFTNAAWGPLTTITKNQTGLRGEANGACLLTHGGSGTYSIWRKQAGLTAGQPATLRAVFNRTGGTATKANIWFYAQGGTETLNIDITLADGTVVENVTPVGTVYKVVVEDDWLIVTCEITTASATEVRMQLLEPVTVAETGSTFVCGNIALFTNTTLEQVAYGSDIFTTSSSVAVAAQTAGWPIANHDQTSGAYYFEFLAPKDFDSYVSADANDTILGLDNSSTSIGYLQGDDSAKGRIVTTDGTNTTTSVDNLTPAPTAWTRVRAGVIFNASEGKIKNCLNGQWSSEGTYDGTFTLGSYIQAFYGEDNFVNSIRLIKIGGTGSMADLEAYIDTEMSA